jgi:polysaccharide biosynthesis transport protein
MSLERFFSILRSHLRHLLIVWLSIVAVVVLASVVTPSRYDARSMVMVEVRSVDPIAGTALPNPNGILSHIPTELDVVRSERVALRAIRSMGLETDPHWSALWREATKGAGSFDAWLAEQLLKNLDVRPSRDSNVITISYSSPDPSFSAKVANAFTNAYIETSVELRVEPAKQYNAFFDETAKRQRANLEQAEANLSNLRRESGMVVTDERVDVENLRLNELSSQVVALQSAAANASMRQRQANTSPESMDEVRRDPVAASLETDLQRQEVKRRELRSRLGDAHPSVIELNNSIAELRERTANASRRAAGSVGIESKVAEGRLGALRAAVEEQRAKVLNLMMQRDRARVMQREVENAQKAYDAVLTRASQTMLESRGTRTNVSVLKLASAPWSASWPKRWLNIVAASVIGLLLAIASVLIREKRDRRLRSAEDVIVLLQQPLLILLPGDARSRRGRPAAPRQLQHRPQPS